MNILYCLLVEFRFCWNQPISNQTTNSPTIVVVSNMMCRVGVANNELHCLLVPLPCRPQVLQIHHWVRSFSSVLKLRPCTPNKILTRKLHRCYKLIAFHNAHFPPRHAHTITGLTLLLNGSADLIRRIVAWQLHVHAVLEGSMGDHCDEEVHPQFPKLEDGVQV